MSKFNLYCFDLDGTLIDSELIHYKAFMDTFTALNLPVKLAYDEYCSYAHHNESSLKNYVNKNLNSKYDYESFSMRKREIYLSYLDDNLKFIPGADTFLSNLLSKGISTCIVTNTDRDIMEKICSILPLLRRVNLILTSDDYINKKPHPECYIKALKHFYDAKNDICAIGFEDSFKGFMALCHAGITPVLINSDQYVLYNEMKAQNSFADFTSLSPDSIYNDQLSNNNYDDFVSSSINNYASALSSSKNHFSTILRQLIPLIRHVKSENNIYLAGIGKCNHVCKKSVSTWQSLGLTCHNLNICDLFHGDFGILKENDTIIYISNSGNTDELINCCKYIKDNFDTLQICLTIKKDVPVEKYVDFHYTITDSTVTEIDSINMAPTTSSILFMSILDMIGVKLGEEKGLTLDKFKLTHPGGDLGRTVNR